MRYAILSRNKNLYSIRRLLHEAVKLRMSVDVLNPLECQLVLDQDKASILYRSSWLPHYAAVLPRIGASITEYGLSLVKHFEIQGVAVLNGSSSIAESRNKLRSLQILNQHGILVPATVLTRSTRGLKKVLEVVNGMPVVVKLLQGTQGIGVMLLSTTVSLHSVLDTLKTLDQDVLLQQFLVEGAGCDYRLLVVGGKVVAAMQRTALRGEFRANIHQGGKAQTIQLPRKYIQTAVKAARVFGLQVAGVDLMESVEGPVVLEVNSSPGFEGIERATKINVARQIMQLMKTQAKKRS
jgi:ribosomal protein S6--L-glutamate ligase